MQVRDVTRREVLVLKVSINLPVNLHQGNIFQFFLGKIRGPRLGELPDLFWFRYSLLLNCLHFEQLSCRNEGDHKDDNGHL